MLVGRQEPGYLWELQTTPCSQMAVTTPSKCGHIFRLDVRASLSWDLHTFGGGFRGGATFTNEPWTSFSDVASLLLSSQLVVIAIVASPNRHSCASSFEANEEV